MFTGQLPKINLEMAPNTAKKNKNCLLMNEEIKPVIFNINYLIF